MSESRASSRATASWEYVWPSIVKPSAPPSVGAAAVDEPVELDVEELVAGAEAAVVAGLGAFADRFISQTSSGSTSANSRSTRSQATRFARAALRAVTRACLSDTS